MSFEGGLRQPPGNSYGDTTVSRRQRGSNDISPDESVRKKSNAKTGSGDGQLSPTNATADQDATRESDSEDEKSSSALHACVHLLCHRDSKGRVLVLYRTGKSWCLILLFYIIFFGCLGAFFALCIMGYKSTLDKNAPKMHGPMSILGDSFPGLTYKPLIPAFTHQHISGVFYNKDKVITYKPFVDNLNNELKALSKSSDHADKQKMCSSRYTNINRTTHSCKLHYNLSKPDTGFENCTAEKDFGYPAGKPCFLLYLNKIHGWRPNIPRSLKDISKSSVSSLEKQLLRGNVGKDYIPITCVGDTAVDVEATRDTIKFWPQQGFDLRYFPFLSRPHYSVPAIWLQISPDPTRAHDMLISIVCKAWIQGVAHHEPRKPDKGKVSSFVLHLYTGSGHAPESYISYTSLLVVTLTFYIIKLV